jgi:outer membrane protein insertion porin family
MALRSPLHFCHLYILIITPIVHAADLTPPAEYEGQTVVRIRFDPPTQPLASADLNRALEYSPGGPLRLADVRAAIKRLYGTGEYSTIEVDTEPAPGGLNLVFRTTSQWFVGPVEAKGKIHLPPNANQLTSAARLDLGAPFSDGDVDAAVGKLQTLLQRNGLFRGTITPEVVRDPRHQQVSITFHVDSGKRARLTLPNVVGDTKMPTASVAHAAEYKEILFFPWKLATQANAESGVQNVRKKYEKQDRLMASVTLDHSDYVAAQNRVRPTIQANGGPKVKIDAEGAKVSKGTLRRYVPVFDEGTVNQDLLVTGARNLRDYFQSRGYFDVQVDLASRNTSPELETIAYKVSLGASHRVVRLSIKGNRYFTTAEIRERMFMQSKGFIRLRRGRYSQSFATRDGEAIQALYPRLPGYYRDPRQLPG